MDCEQLRKMADEVAAAMAECFGASPRAARSGSALEAALFFHGRRLSARLQRHARRLAQADRQCRSDTGAAPKFRARRLERGHEALMRDLRRRRQAAPPGRRVRLAATLVFGLMLLAAAVLWLQVSRGQG